MSSAHKNGPAGRRTTAGRHNRREQGVALVMVLTVVAILSIFFVFFHESTTTALSIAASQRDQLRAEYIAKSGLNLTRLLISKEPQITRAVAPLYRLLIKRRAPQINVWRFADQILGPFFNRPATDQLGSDEDEIALTSSFDLSEAEGLESLGGTFHIAASVENSKINLNNPLFRSGTDAKRSTAMQLFMLMGGHQNPNPYDPLFSRQDADGHYTTPLDIVSAAIDWWDYDQRRTVFDPGSSMIGEAGSEDDVYSSLDDPYQVKNAPYDSLQELRMIRGIDDDFWATFIEPDPDDPEKRQVTIYGSGSVNVNEAPPLVMLARLCSFLIEQPQALCRDPLEGAKFVQLVGTMRSLVPIAWFSSPYDFVKFVEGSGGPTDLYPMLRMLLGADSPLLFQPLSIPHLLRPALGRAFITSASIITIQSTAAVGRARVRLDTVVNFDRRWTPPPPNPGTMPALGVLHYYRLD